MTTFRPTLTLINVLALSAYDAVLCHVIGNGWPFWLFAMPVVICFAGIAAELNRDLEQAGYRDGLVTAWRWLKCLRSDYRLRGKFDLPGKADLRAYLDTVTMIRAVYEDAMGFDQNVEVSFDQVVDDDTVRVNLIGKTPLGQAAIRLVRERIRTMRDGSDGLLRP